MAMAASRSDSFSSGSNFSDTDLETINCEELVIFHSTPTAFCNKNDIVVVYSSGNAVSASPKDWIGLFQTGWQTMHDFSAFQWVPFNPLHPSQPRKRRTIFPQADIGNILGRFQFLYMTGDNEVIGVSDFFDVCGVELASESYSFIQERIPSSLSLISLGSLSSSSDEYASLELVSEKITDVAEETYSNPASVKPELSALVPRKDYWTLSDFVVGSNVESLLQKLRFVQSYDWMSDLEASKPIYLAAQHGMQKHFIEEIQPKSSESAALSSDQTATSSETAVPDPSGCSFTPFYLSGPLVFTYYPEGLSSQKSCLQMYHPNLLTSSVEETDNKVASKKKEALEVSLYRKWTLPDCKSSHQESSSIQQKQLSMTSPCLLMDKSPEQCSIQIRTRKLEGGHRDLTFSFKEREPEENNQDSSQSETAVQPGPVHFSGTKTAKQATFKSGENLRKKRWVQRSNIQNNRDKQELMLQKVMTMLDKPSSSNDMRVTNQQKSEHEESVFSVSANRSKDSCRKRRNHNAPVISKAKRRRLTRRSATPPPPCLLNVEEDEGYCSLGEEGNVMINSNCAEDSLELLSLALTEALKDNAELRIQLGQASGKQPTTVDCTCSSTAKVCKEKVSQSEKPVTCSKAVSTDEQKTCDAAVNTKQKAKRDHLVQCGKSRKGKATNTDRKTERHAASNTTAVVKTDAPSQCVTSSVKSINTLPRAPTRDASNNTPKHCHTRSSTSDRKNTLVTQSEAMPLDLTANTVKRPDTTTEDPNEHVSEWKKVSSKRMIRLQKLITKKKMEYTRVRENAENFEKKSHALENNLQSARSALSMERAKRMNAENELRELRIKFWELMAFRRSQPWGNTKQTPGKFGFHEKSKESKLSTVSEPYLAENSKTFSTQTLATERVTPRQANSSPENKAKSQETLTETSKPKKSPAYTATEESKRNKTEGNGDNSMDPRHSPSAADRLNPPEQIPVVTTAQINGVPVQVAEVKKATCGSISFKKFILPAMTALAETFSSSKSKSKTSTTDDPTPNTTPTSTTQSSKSSSSSFAKVTVSISAGIPAAKSSSKQQKTSSKNKSAKRSSSRSKEKTKPGSNKLPCQETFPDSSSDITLRRRRSPAYPKPPNLDHTEVLPSPIILPFPKADTSRSAESAANTSGNVHEKGEEPCTTEEKWRPLNIPARACADDDGDVGSDVTAPIMPPVSMYSAGKGRPFTSPDATAGKFTRNQFAKAVMSRYPEPLTYRDVIRTASSEMPDVIQSPRCGTFTWGDNTGQRKHHPLHPPLPSPPLPCLFHRPTPPRFSASLSTPSITPFPFPSLPLHPPPPHVITSQPQRFSSEGPKPDPREQRPQPCRHSVTSLPQPRALHFGFFGASNDAVGRQIQQGRCRTCGMKFAPSVDRYLVEEHLYFHHAFTE